MGLTDDAIGQIKQMIQQGELRPGDRLPPEAELGERLGLSRSSLREAVKALEAMRVLDVRRGDGTYVTSLEPAHLLEAVSFVLDFHESNAILDVFAVRRVLETASASAAAVHADAGQLAAIRETLESVTAETPLEQLVDHDRAFHRAVATASGNGYLAGLLESVSGQTVRARVWRGITEQRVIERTLVEHQRIAEAIERGDAELAAAAMTVHIAGVEQWLRQHLESP